MRAPTQSLSHAYKRPAEASSCFQEGLYLSSPEFWEELRKAGVHPENEKLERSLHKYWLRSCSRCTPYGTFAGTAMVSVTDDETSLLLNDNSQHIRHVRIDMEYMTRLANSAARLPILLEQVRFYTNNSLYELPDSLRYAEYSLRDNTRHYRLSSIEKSDYVMAVLERARDGGTIAQLSAMVMSSERVGEEEARSFIISMWASQLLISELEPSITGKDPLDRFIGQVSAFNGTDQLVRTLREIGQLLRSPKEGFAFYRSVDSALKDLNVSLQARYNGLLRDPHDGIYPIAQVTAPEAPKNCLQVDLYLSTGSDHINKELIERITQQAADLTALSRRNMNPGLEHFKTKFSARYEGAEIPLSIALDAEIGIGYAGITDEAAGGAELIDDLVIAMADKEMLTKTDYITSFVNSKYQDFLQHQRDCIEVTEKELSGLRKQTEKYIFPNSMFLMGTLMKKEGRLDPGNFMFDLAVFGGPSAANLLGRFAQGDERICRAAREILQQEESEYPDALYAEIAHQPQARIGNVLLRPLLRRYEIPYVGKSGAPQEDQIPIDDITVSVINNEIVLHSKRLRKRIIPRLSTAHNFSVGSLPVYKFLCDLQGQGLAYPNVWDWGQLDLFDQLPRVTYRNIILKKARWRIEEKKIGDLPVAVSEQPSYFRDFCRKWNIPQRVVYKEADNGLLIDLGEKSGIDLFLHYVRRHKVITVEEALQHEENCIVSDRAGSPYASELIIPLQTAGSKRPYSMAERQYDRPPVKRKYSPYSEWLYFKLYCGPSTAEKILKDALLPFVEGGMRDGLFERFFFIRYRDEFPHLRIRFYNAAIARQPELLKAFTQTMQPYLDNGLIDKIGLDTYSRELERYGAGMIEDSEKIFHNDSLAMLRFIALLEEEREYRLLFALRGIDMLLDDFRLDPGNRSVLLRRMQSAFFSEFGGSPYLQKQLNAKYRKYQRTLFSHMNSADDAQNAIEDGVAIFNLRSEMNNEAVRSILAKLAPGNPGPELFALLTSYIHMYMNRLFIAHQRKYEMVVYHFLAKYYASRIALKKKEVTGPAMT